MEPEIDARADEFVTIAEAAPATAQVQDSPQETPQGPQANEKGEGQRRRTATKAGERTRQAGVFPCPGNSKWGFVPGGRSAGDRKIVMTTTANEIELPGKGSEPEVPLRKRRFTLTATFPAAFLEAIEEAGGINGSGAAPTKAEKKELDTLVVKIKGLGTFSTAGKKYPLSETSTTLRIRTTFYAMPDDTMLYRLRGTWFSLTLGGAEGAQTIADVRERNEVRGMLSPRKCPVCNSLFEPARRDQVYDKKGCKTIAGVRRLRAREKVAL